MAAKVLSNVPRFHDVTTTVGVLQIRTTFELEEKERQERMRGAVSLHAFFDDP